MILTLPIPPTINHYWGRSGHRSFLSKKALEFREKVVNAVIDSKHPGFGNARLFLHMTVHFATKGRADIDNRCKAGIDALMHAGLFNDDSQIDEILIKRGEVIKGGKCVVFIDKMV